MTTDCKTCSLAIFEHTSTGKVKRGLAGTCTYRHKSEKRCHAITVQLHRVYIWPGIHEKPCEAYEAIK